MSSNQFVGSMLQKARKTQDYSQKKKNLIKEYEDSDFELGRLKKDKRKLDDKLERRYWDKERANKETGIFSGIHKKSAKSSYDKSQNKSIKALNKVNQRKKEISEGEEVQGDLKAYKNRAGKNWDEKERKARVVSRFISAGRRTKKRRKTKKKKRKRRKRNLKKRTKRRRRSKRRRRR